MPDPCWCGFSGLLRSLLLLFAGGAAAENRGDPVCGILRRFGAEVLENLGSDRGKLCSPFFVNYDHKWECNRCVTA